MPRTPTRAWARLCLFSYVGLKRFLVFGVFSLRSAGQHPDASVFLVSAEQLSASVSTGKSFQQQREAMKQTIEEDEPEKSGRSLLRPRYDLIAVKTRVGLEVM